MFFLFQQQVQVLSVYSHGTSTPINGTREYSHLPSAPLPWDSHHGTPMGVVKVYRHHRLLGRQGRESSGSELGERIFVFSLFRILIFSSIMMIHLTVLANC